MLIEALAFALVCGLIVWLHFAFALREWRRTRGTPTLAIDMAYTRSESYLPASFRSKLSEWLQMEARPAGGEAGHVIERGRERIRVLPSTKLPDGFHTEAVLVVLGDLTCGEQCRFEREVYVEGECTIGAGAQVQAIAVDGDLLLGPNVMVTRWADAEGRITIGEGCRVGARVTSRRAIHISAGARASSFYAPEVRTLSMRTGPPPPEDSGLPPLRLPPAEPDRGTWSHAEDRAHAICWRHRGDLHSERPLDVDRTLIVQGQLRAGPGSRFTADLKASGSIVVGAGSHCHGTLVSDRSIVVGPGSDLAGLVLAGHCAVLDRGVRGGGERTFAAFAQHVLYVRDGVVLNGKLAAGQYVRVLGPDEEAAVTDGV